MIVFINRFTVTGDPRAFERAFADTAAHLAERPGFLRHRLVRSTDDPRSYVNVAEWETAADLRAAVHGPAFDEHARSLRALAHSEPHVYEVVIERGTGPAPHAVAESA
ncbi:antibiotic biosynthesis monooxygenase family protein [Streptomyces sp. SudanB182_2057]|uniref:antibiotic biosynthesis monooxygenase family protein n=1 Tax=Streptomyces sp. SudanB182_2057 TaxID=3035281 RepID=UPI003F556F5B